MTHASEKVKVGRQPRVLVHLLLDTCSLTYGNAPCTASGSAGQECYNTRSTCQDPANFSQSTKTYKFCDDSARLIDGYIPVLKSVTFSPPKLAANLGLGIRGSVRITLTDFPGHDRGVDPYVANRSSEAAGTYWRRLLARNLYTKSRSIEVYTGYMGDAFAIGNFQKRVYVIEQIDGPDRRGQVTITGRDPLQLADDDRAKAPAPSGVALNGAITDSATTITVTDGTIFSANDYVRINDEIIKVGAVSSNDLTGCTRAQWGTTADAHEDDDDVQLCLEYNATNVVDVIEDLLTNYVSNFDASWIPSTDWATEESNLLSGNSVTALISEPTGVKTLLEELVRQNLIRLYWSDVDQEVRLKAIAPGMLNASPDTYSDDHHFLRDSLRVMRDPKDRYSRVLVYYDLRDYAGDLDGDNCRKAYLSIDANAETAEQYGEERTLEIVSRWWDAGDKSTVEQQAVRLLQRFRDIPLRLGFSMDAKDSALGMADQFIADTDRMVAIDGSNLGPTMEVLAIKEAQPGHRIEGEALQLQFTGRYAFIAPNGTGDYSAETEANKAAYAFIANDSGVMPSDGAQGYLII